jgi:hypothetical protein
LSPAALSVAVLTRTAGCTIGTCFPRSHHRICHASVQFVAHSSKLWRKLQLSYTRIAQHQCIGLTRVEATLISTQSPSLMER